MTTVHGLEIILIASRDDQTKEDVEMMLMNSITTTQQQQLSRFPELRIARTCPLTRVCCCCCLCNWSCLPIFSSFSPRSDLLLLPQTLSSVDLISPLVATSLGDSKSGRGRKLNVALQVILQHLPESVPGKRNASRLQEN